MATRRVVGSFLNIDNSPLFGGKVTFNLLAPFYTSTGIVPVEEHIETLDVNGEFGITLPVPDTGTALYQVHLPDGEYHNIYLASGPETNIQTLITIATSAVAQDPAQTLLDANNTFNVVNATTAHDILATDDYLRCNGTFTATLTERAVGTGKLIHVIKNINSGNILLVGTSGDTIEGYASYNIPPHECLTVVDGAAGNWDIIGA